MTLKERTLDVDTEISKWDATLTRQTVEKVRPLVNLYHRAEVRGLESLPPGGALVVSNHSGGLFPMDAPVFTSAFYSKFAYERPVVILSHDAMMAPPLTELLNRIGFVKANHKNADAALRSGSVVLVFPGGVYDLYRPTKAGARIDFNGHTGYVRAAIRAGVPIVPMVAIGGQESQLFLSRGSWLARRLGPLGRWARTEIVPLTFGLPFGFIAGPPVNLPLPTKIVMQVLDPIDIVAQFGADPDVHAVDRHVRQAMQRAMDALAADRRLPVLG